MSRYENILQDTIKQTAEPLPEHEAIRYEEDPRPELKTDHILWVKVLTNARELDQELYHMLKYIRQEGGGLQQTKKGLKLVPGLWLSNDWERVKTEILTPLKDKLVKLFYLCQMGIALSGQYEFPESDTKVEQEVLFND